jgi:hypothetical protein
MTTYGTNGATQHDNPGMGFPSGGLSWTQYLLVKYPNAILTLCAKDANDDWIGVTQNNDLQGPVNIPVRFRSAGTFLCTMAFAETINPGTLVYKQANGTVGLESTGSIAVGLALTYGTNAGNWIEILPIH